MRYLDAERRQHSEKPVEARAIIERLSPEPRIELFAMATPHASAAWGAEAHFQ